MKSNISNAFYTSLATIASNRPELNLQHSNAISNSAFRVLATHSKFSNLTPDDYAEMVAEATKGGFRVIAESLQPLGYTDSLGTQYISMIVEANTKVEEFNEEEINKKMKVVTASIFEDGESRLWRVVEANGKKLLVQTEQEDFDKILQDRISRTPVIASNSSNFHGLVPSLGDFVVYYDANAMEVRAGLSLFAEDKLVVADTKDASDWKEITTEQVIETVTAKTIPMDVSPLPCLVKIWERKNETKAASEPTENEFTSQDARDVIGFYRNLYAGTDYFKEMIDLIAERRNFGKNDRPLIQNIY